MAVSMRMAMWAPRRVPIVWATPRPGNQARMGIGIVGLIVIIVIIILVLRVL
jgi:hypothetical protein